MAPKKIHKTWRRVFISIFGILIILFVWRWSIGHLYTLPQYAIAAFTSLTVSVFYTISVVVVFLVTGLTFFSWSQSTSIQSTVEGLIKHIKGPDKENDEDDKKEKQKEPTRSDHYDE